jgi:ribonuclease D
MTIIDSSDQLAALCERLGREPYVTVDTEFIREKTYWPRLCLLQLAGRDEAVGVDPLAPGLDLEPLFELLVRPEVVKVFHAARQDIEIFHHLSGRIPAPLFDSQVAAMVCGFGESASYETLAAKLANARIDKNLRFTDWSRRPLTERQIQYAISDVTHLRVIYEKLRRQLEKTGRTAWLAEEMAVLKDPATYAPHPEEVWRRIKTRSRDRRFLAVLREVTAWRELEAQSRDMPRNHVLREGALIEIAAHPPTTAQELARVRGMPEGLARGKRGERIIAAARRGLALPESELPQLERPRSPAGVGPLVELLKVLLKMKCEAHHVAQKLVASSADLERIAAEDQAPVAALKGWRREIFGDAALRLKRGELALAASGREVTLIEVTGGRGAEGGER